ncbi:hypothetical protein ACI2JA_03705 [Alkalihalobacillus sp. NPDC078783]
MCIIKILKIAKLSESDFRIVFDNIPELTYEKIGVDYVGSVVDNKGRVILSEHLKKYPYGNAFAGRELTLKMKDGSIEKIKDYWFDQGSYKEHGEFVSIGAGTVKSLQRCYVYSGMNVNEGALNKMIEKYLTKDKAYKYDEVEEWCKLKYKWYPVIVHGKKIPYMMNKHGDMVDVWNKKRVSSRYNYIKYINGQAKRSTYFKFQYNNGNRLIKLEADYLEVLKETLPHPIDKIKKNCKLG